MSIDLRCGDWRTALADVEMVDALICDPPYSERVEAGVRSGSTMSDQRVQIGMGYQPITEEWARSFVEEWSPRCRGWIVVYGDHISARWFEEALSAVRYVFAPIPLIKRGAAPRMCADGPASQAEWIVAARPKRAEFVGSWPGIPGWYFMDTVRHGHGHGHCGVRGAKSIEHMRAIVRDYSRRGDLVVDPCAGGATTLLAAAMEGRRAVGAELDPETHAKAQKRIAKGYTLPLFVDRKPEPQQEPLL